MDNFKERQKAFEQKFANDAEVLFKVNAGRNRLVAEWVAELLGFDDKAREDYIVEVIESDLKEPGDNDVIAKVKDDLDKHGQQVTEKEIRSKLEGFFGQARDNFMNSL